MTIFPAMVVTELTTCAAAVECSHVQCMPVPKCSCCMLLALKGDSVLHAVGP